MIRRRRDLSTSEINISLITHLKIPDGSLSVLIYQYVCWSPGHMLAGHRLVLRLLTVRATPRAPSANAVLTDAASILLAERSCSPEPHRFAALRAETAAAFPGGAHMVSGAQQGRLLHMLVKLARAQRVLEVGCFTGYAALWMALALPPDGSLVRLERDERCAAVARKHLDAAGVASRVELRMGDAVEELENIRRGSIPPFDLIFLDADKKRTALSCCLRVTCLHRTRCCLLIMCCGRGMCWSGCMARTRVLRTRRCKPRSALHGALVPSVMPSMTFRPSSRAMSAYGSCCSHCGTV